MKNENVIIKKGNDQRNLIVESKGVLTKEQIKQLQEQGFRSNYEYKVILNANPYEEINSFVNKVILKNDSWVGFFINEKDKLKAFSINWSDLEELMHKLNAFVSTEGVIFLYGEHKFMVTLDFKSHNCYHINDLVTNNLDGVKIKRFCEIDGDVYLYYYSNGVLDEEKLEKIKINISYKFWGSSQVIELTTDDCEQKVKPIDKLHKNKIAKVSLSPKAEDKIIKSKELKKAIIDSMPNSKKIKRIRYESIIKYRAIGNDTLNSYTRSIYLISGEILPRFFESSRVTGIFKSIVVEDICGNLSVVDFEYSSNSNMQSIVSDEGIIILMSDKYVWYIFDGKVRSIQHLRSSKNYPTEQYQLVHKDGCVHIESGYHDYIPQFTFNFLEKDNPILDVTLKEQEES